MKEDEQHTGAAIIGRADGVSDNAVPQSLTLELALERLKATPNSEVQASLLHRIYRNSAIETRHLAFEPVLPPGIEDQIDVRFQKAVKHMSPIAVNVAKEAMDSCHVAPEDVGCLVTVSTTAIAEPGISSHLVEGLSLSREVERIGITFGGCAKDKVALVVVYEVVSVHTRGIVENVSGEVLHALMSDGCAGLVVAAQGSRFENKVIQNGGASVQLLARRAELVENTQDGIGPLIRPTGIFCGLSKKLPGYVHDVIDGFVDKLVASTDLDVDDIRYWAIHPGGRKIIEAVQDKMGIGYDSVKESYDVLREYGNMTAPSVLFVLNRIAKNHLMEHKAGDAPKLGLAFAFGPGVSVEGFLYKVKTALDRQE